MNRFSLIAILLICLCSIGQAHTPGGQLTVAELDRITFLESAIAGNDAHSDIVQELIDGWYADIDAEMAKPYEERNMELVVVWVMYINNGIDLIEENEALNAGYEQEISDIENGVIHL